jgi:hypothetical protein
MRYCRACGGEIVFWEYRRVTWSVGRDGKVVDEIDEKVGAVSSYGCPRWGRRFGSGENPAEEVATGP